MANNGGKQNDEHVQGEEDFCKTGNTPNQFEHCVDVLVNEESLLMQDSIQDMHFDRRPSLQWLRRLKVPISVPSFVKLGQYLNIHSARNCKKWLSHPLNLALLVWFLCVAVSGAMLVLLFLGVLNKAIPDKAYRKNWIEINNQILNALFTLMSIYQHPYFCHHFVLVCRWKLKDVKELRKVYCKNGSCQTGERVHLMIVVVLLHVACISQYVLCGLYWGFSRTQRPEIVESCFFAASVLSPVCAGLYVVYSPLGRRSDSNISDDVKESVISELRIYDDGVVIENPEWAGGLFDCGKDKTLCCLSFFCTCCLFGSNMERLGFGNMYVHLSMFLLLCIAPFWIFNVSALNIHNEDLADIIGYVGIVLCFFGLIYGGFWRIEMRKKYRLPESKIPCCSESLTSYIKWLFCWPCALAQEVRTGDLYDIGYESLEGVSATNDDLEGESRRSSSVKEEISAIEYNHVSRDDVTISIPSNQVIML